MTAGTVVVLGDVGLNFGAGMTGGEAFVYDPAQRSISSSTPISSSLPLRAGTASTSFVSCSNAMRGTRARLAPRLLDAWERESRLFVHVAPSTETTTIDTDAELVAEGRREVAAVGPPLHSLSDEPHRLDVDAVVVA